MWNKQFIGISLIKNWKQTLKMKLRRNWNKSEGYQN